MTNAGIHVAAFLVGLGAVAYATHLIWAHLIKPITITLTKITKALVAFSESWPILDEIAHEFKPNDGATLRDQVDMMNLRMHNIEGSVEKLVQFHIDNGLWSGEERRDI